MGVAPIPVHGPPTSDRFGVDVASLGAADGFRLGTC